MIEIDDKLISEEVLTTHFCCEVAVCRGQCCVEGDGGAPLELAETEALEAEWAAYKPFMTPAGVKAVERQGFFTVDGDGDLVTPLVGGGSNGSDGGGVCAYSYEEKGVTLCAIERAWKLGQTAFRKPISCHLYPIRLIKLSDGRVGLNYHRWSVCAGAAECGERGNIPLYAALREALTRRFGAEFYDALTQAAELLEAE